jgi:hypothetical protein
MEKKGEDGRRNPKEKGEKIRRKVQGKRFRESKVYIVVDTYS